MAGSLIVRAKLNGPAGKQAINIYIVLSISPPLSPFAFPPVVQ